eukprot:GHVT01006285.1.p1 GENE.GHVT01006285.1~~GHVT01006285.1.p1  ORF type:complete len:568 (-),score=95.78 GHVT01006285.1:277-1980(-)
MRMHRLPVVDFLVHAASLAGGWRGPSAQLLLVVTGWTAAGTAAVWMRNKHRENFEAVHPYAGCARALAEESSSLQKLVGASFEWTASRSGKGRSSDSFKRCRQTCQGPNGKFVLHTTARRSTFPGAEASDVPLEPVLSFGDYYDRPHLLKERMLLYWSNSKFISDTFFASSSSSECNGAATAPTATTATAALQLDVNQKPLGHGLCFGRPGTENSEWKIVSLFAVGYPNPPIHIRESSPTQITNGDGGDHADAACNPPQPADKSSPVLRMTDVTAAAAADISCATHSAEDVCTPESQGSVSTAKNTAPAPLQANPQRREETTTATPSNEHELAAAPLARGWGAVAATAAATAEAVNGVIIGAARWVRGPSSKEEPDDYTPPHAPTTNAAHSQSTCTGSRVSTNEESHSCSNTSSSSNGATLDAPLSAKEPCTDDVFIIPGGSSSCFIYPLLGRPLDDPDFQMYVHRDRANFSHPKQLLLLKLFGLCAAILTIKKSHSALSAWRDTRNAYTFVRRLVQEHPEIHRALGGVPPASSVLVNGKLSATTIDAVASFPFPQRPDSGEATLVS